MTSLEIPIGDMDPTNRRGALYTVDELPKEGRTEIGIAAARGDIEECERLLEAGSSPSDADEYLETPLHLACCFGQLDVVKVLLKEHNVPIDPRNWEGWTPICYAVSRGHIELMKYLLKNKADGEWSSAFGWKLLHIAAWYNQTEMVSWLTSHGAPAAPQTTQNRRPFDMTRPGETRRAIYQAQLNENDAAVK